MADKFKNQRREMGTPHLSLADLRQSHRMTQAAVAEQVAALTDEPFYSGSLSLIEIGKRGASEPVLRALEQIFHLRTGALLTTYQPSHARRKVEDPAA